MSFQQKPATFEEQVFVAFLLNKASVLKQNSPSILH